MKGIGVRKLFVVLAVFLFAAGAAVAETVYLNSGSIIEGKAVDGAGSSFKPAESAKHFLWKVSGPDKATVYLFGSIHLGKPGMFPLAEPIERAFDSSDVLVVEVNLNAVDPVQAARLVQEKGLYPRGDLLAYHLSSDTRARLRKTLKRYGIAPELVQQYKPWFLAMTLTVAQVESLGFSKDYGVDQYLLNKAAPVGAVPVKEVIELESFAQQLSFLDGIPDQDMFLSYTLDSLSETEQTLPELIDAWQSGAADRLQKIFLDDIVQKNPAIEPILKTVLFDRNITMSERLKVFLAGDRIFFVVVGAAHLVGPRGIVEQLRAAGFQVDQL